MKRLIVILICIAAIAIAQKPPAAPPPAPQPVASAAPNTPTEVTDKDEQESLSRGMLALVLARNQLLDLRSKTPALLQAEAAVQKANEDYGIVLAKSQAAHNARGCELTADKKWGCPPGTPVPPPPNK